MIPCEFHCGRRAARRELVAHDQPGRRGLRICWRTFRLDAGRGAQLQSPERQVGVMATHISQRAAAEIPPPPPRLRRSEEHTSELQSLRHLVCRLLLEKK